MKKNMKKKKNIINTNEEEYEDEKLKIIFLIEVIKQIKKRGFI